MIKKKEIKYILGNNNCHVCVSHKTDRHGYPRCSRNNINWLLYRYIYFLNYGNIPKDKVVRHICDNRECINPKHLILGTQQENMDDCKERNRGNKGERNPNVKVTEGQVIEIKKLRKNEKFTIKQLEKKYNFISKQIIERIVYNKTWKHIEDE